MAGAVATAGTAGTAVVVAGTVAVATAGAAVAGTAAATVVVAEGTVVAAMVVVVTVVAATVGAEVTTNALGAGVRRHHGTSPKAMFPQIEMNLHGRHSIRRQLRKKRRRAGRRYPCLPPLTAPERRRRSSALDVLFALCRSSATLTGLSVTWRYSVETVDAEILRTRRFLMDVAREQANDIADLEARCQCNELNKPAQKAVHLSGVGKSRHNGEHASREKNIPFEELRKNHP
jgi:hypothetical protein